MVLAIGFMGETQVSAATLQEYTQANQICEICYQGYNGGTQGPIIVTRGFLKKGNSSKEVYLVTLSGTELVGEPAEKEPKRFYTVREKSPKYGSKKTETEPLSEKQSFVWDEDK